MLSPYENKSKGYIVCSMPSRFPSQWPKQYPSGAILTYRDFTQHLDSGKPLYVVIPHMGLVVRYPYIWDPVSVDRQAKTFFNVGELNGHNGNFIFHSFWHAYAYAVQVSSGHEKWK